MKNFLLTSLSTVLLPFAGYATQPLGSYQRSYLSAAAPSANGILSSGASHKQLLSATNTLTDTANMQIELQQAMPVNELFIVDAALSAADKAILRRAVKPGVAWVELDATSSGLAQLKQALVPYANLATVRIFSHATAGALSLGDGKVDANSLMQHPDIFTALNAALRKGGDLLFYGCELAQGAKGEQFIDILKNNTHIDIAASNNLTGNAALGGDWDLEIHKGDINASPLEQSIALKDFTSVLETFDFTSSDVTNQGGTTSADDVIVNESGPGTNFSLVVNGATQGVDANATYRQYAYLGYDGGGGTETSVTLSFTGNQTFDPASLNITNWTLSPTVFTFTSNVSGSVSTASLANGASQSVNLSALASNTSVLTITANVPFKAGLDDIVLENIVVPDSTPPAVSSITISGTPSANASSITYVVAFNEHANNISTDDFQVTTVSGSATASVSAVSASSGTSINVTVSGISGTGTLRLDLKNNTNITDDSGNGNNTNGYVAAYTAGATHNVDRDAPAAPSTPDLSAASDSGASSSDNVTNDNTPTFTGTAEANSTVAIISSVSGTLGTTTADGAGNWSYTAGAMAQGGHTITATATDAASNTSTASSGLSITIDTTAPTASIVLADSSLTVGETSLVTITFNEAVSGFTNADLTVANGTLSSVASSDGGITWTATFTPNASTTDSTNVIALDNTGVTDAAGNIGSGSTNSNNYAIDTARPTATLVVSDTALAIDETSVVTITFSEAVSGFTNADLSVANGSLSAVSSSDGGTTWTATFTPTASITDNTNVITLDNTGVTDAAGN